MGPSFPLALKYADLQQKGNHMVFKRVGSRPALVPPPASANTGPETGLPGAQLWGIPGGFHEKIHVKGLEQTYWTAP